MILHNNKVYLNFKLGVNHQKKNKLFDQINTIMFKFHGRNIQISNGYFSEHVGTCNKQKIKIY